MTDDLQRGMDVRRELFGEERTSTAFADPDPLVQEFQTLLTSYCFGSLWGKDGVEWRDRSLMTLCLVAAQHRFAEFETHMRLAVRNGCERQVLIELVRHIAIYCGIPAGVEAFRITKRVLDEIESG